MNSFPFPFPFPSAWMGSSLTEMASSSSESSSSTSTSKYNIVLSTITLSTIIATNWFLYFNYKVNKFDQHVTEWNDTEWRIEGIQRPSYFIRFINVGAFGGSSVANFMLYILNKYSITPALNKSIKLMEEADQQNDIPKILCNRKARTEMKLRIENYYMDIYETTSLTIIGKILNYYQSSIDLSNHYGILKMGMSSTEIQKELIIKPVFIVSLPRTGTTILHRTMSKDNKSFKCFDMCDMILPLPKPIPRWDIIGRAEKAKELQFKIDTEIELIYPNYFNCIASMHDFIPNEADESLSWYNSGLGHHYMDSLMKLYPLYRNINGCSNGRHTLGINELIESNDTALYRYEWTKLIMKIYQYNDKKEWFERGYSVGKNGESIDCPTNNIPWLMKDPDHSAYLPQLIKVFGCQSSVTNNSIPCEPKLIFSHRNPTDIIASVTKVFVIFCMMDALPATPGTSAEEWGVEDNRRIQRYINGIASFTKDKTNSKSITNKREHDNDDGEDGESASTQQRSNDDPFAFQFVRNGDDVPTNGFIRNRIDIHFLDLVTNIPGAIEIIYKQFGYTQVTDDARSAFKLYLKDNHRDKHGNQKHRLLSQLSLEEDDVNNVVYNKLILEKYPEYNNPSLYSNINIFK